VTETAPLCDGSNDAVSLPVHLYPSPRVALVVTLQDLPAYAPAPCPRTWADAQPEKGVGLAFSIPGGAFKPHHLGQSQDLLGRQDHRGRLPVRPACSELPQ
jgi:hypothetical protein